MNIRPVWADLSVRTDGQTDTMKLIVAFRNFLNVPYKMISNKYEGLYLSEGLVILFASL